MCTCCVHAFVCTHTSLHVQGFGGSRVALECTLVHIRCIGVGICHNAILHTYVLTYIRLQCSIAYRYRNAYKTVHIGVMYN